MTTVIQNIVMKVIAIKNCEKTKNEEWLSLHREKLKELIDNHLPHGSGIDGEIDIDINGSDEKRIVIYFEYHHMNAHGVYDGWSNYKLICEPRFSIEHLGLIVLGEDRNGTKEYLGELFYQALIKKVEKDV